MVLTKQNIMSYIIERLRIRLNIIITASAASAPNRVIWRELRTSERSISKFMSQIGELISSVYSLKSMTKKMGGEDRHFECNAK